MSRSIAALSTQLLLVLGPVSVAGAGEAVELAQKDASERATEIPGRTPRLALPPDLVVERAWLRECEIHFRVANRGRGAIPAAEHARADVIVYWKSLTSAPVNTRIFSLATVDPAGRLKDPGGAVSFETGISLRARHWVDVHVDKDGDIRELSDSNNRLDPMPLLTPSTRCLPRVRPPEPGSKKLAP